MATTTQYPSFRTARYAKFEGTGSVVLSLASQTIGTAINDAIQFRRLARGQKIVWGWLQTGRGDTSTGLTLSLVVTDGTTTKTIISASTVAQGASGGLAIPTKQPSTEDALGFATPNDNWWIELRATAAATTPAAFTVKICVMFDGVYEKEDSVTQ